MLRTTKQKSRHLATFLFCGAYGSIGWILVMHWVCVSVLFFNELRQFDVAKCFNLLKKCRKDVGKFHKLLLSLLQILKTQYLWL